MKMSNFLILALLAAKPVLAGPTVSGGILKVYAMCVTSDQKYRITVFGETSQSDAGTKNLKVEVYDGNTELQASYVVEKYIGMQSASFGRSHYQDAETQGGQFLLQGPSTNFRHYSADFLLNRREGDLRITDDDLSCKIFDGFFTEQDR